jgi:hypothetical protein
MKITIAAAALVLAAGNLKAETLFPIDETLYSRIVSLSRATHGWLYDYANTVPDGGNYPGSILIGFPIWPDNRFKSSSFGSRATMLRRVNNEIK